MSGFDWTRDDSIVVPEQQAIAVFTNVHGRIAILQKGDYHPDEDVVIVVNRKNAAQLARAILALAEPDAAPLALPAPTDKTAAERQRRHRDRKRNGDDTVTAVTVTPCARNGASLFPD